MTDEVQTYHLKTLFSNYEKSFLMEHLVLYLKKIQRHLPQTSAISQTQTFLNSDHSLIQFQSPPESCVNAYELFPLEVKLWHAFSPSQLFFTAKLSNIEQFPNSYTLLHAQQTDLNQNTMLALNTPTGTLNIPSHYPKHQQKAILIHNLTLNLHLEQLQYSMAPYHVWHQVETAGGHLYFPSEPGILHSFPPLQNENIRTFPHLPRNVSFHQTNSDMFYQEDDYSPRSYRPHRPFSDRFPQNQNTFRDPAPEFQQQNNPQSEFPQQIGPYSHLYGPPHPDPATTHIQTGVAYTAPVFPPIPNNPSSQAPNNELSSSAYPPPSHAAVGSSHPQNLGAASLPPDPETLAQQYLSDQLNNIIGIQQQQRVQENGMKPQQKPMPSTMSRPPSNTNITRPPGIPQPRIHPPRPFRPPGPQTPIQQCAPRPQFFRGQTTPYLPRQPQHKRVSQRQLNPRHHLHQNSLVTGQVDLHQVSQPPNLSKYRLQPVPLPKQPPAQSKSDQHPPGPKPPPASRQEQPPSGAQLVQPDPGYLNPECP